MASPGSQVDTYHAGHYDGLFSVACRSDAYCELTTPQNVGGASGFHALETPAATVSCVLGVDVLERKAEIAEIDQKYSIEMVGRQNPGLGSHWQQRVRYLDPEQHEMALFLFPS